MTKLKKNFCKEPSSLPSLLDPRWIRKETLRDRIPHADIQTWEDFGHFPELEQTDRYLELLRQRENP